MFICGNNIYYSNNAHVRTYCGDYSNIPENYLYPTMQMPHPLPFGMSSHYYTTVTSVGKTLSFLFIAFLLTFLSIYLMKAVKLIVLAIREYKENHHWQSASSN
jgi:hypothetical protein